jgi:hypothetical protein
VFAVTVIDGWEGLPSNIEAQLREQEICMDDWDFMLIVDQDLLCVEEGKLRPDSYTLERLCTSCDDMQWFLIDLDNKKMGLGVAYH